MGEKRRRLKRDVRGADNMSGTESLASLSLGGLVERWREGHPGRWLRDMSEKVVEWGGSMRLADVVATCRERDEPGTLGRFVAWLQCEGARRMRVEVVRGADGRPVRRRREWREAASAQTVRHAVAVAVRVLRWGVGRGRLRADQVGDRPRLPRAVRRPRDVRPDDVRRLLAGGLGAAESLVRFLFATGARPGEGCGLDWGEVDLARGVAVLGGHKVAGRTGGARVIYLTAEAAAVLVGLGERRGGRVFLNSRGRPYTTGQIGKILRRRGVTTYRARHTFGQAVLDQFGIEDVARLLGHSDLRMAQVYAQVRDVRARAVAGALALSPLAQTAGNDDTRFRVYVNGVE